MSDESTGQHLDIFSSRFQGPEKRLPGTPFRNVDTIFRAIWRQNYTKPRALGKRLERLEATCVQILIDLECWDSDSSDIIMTRYFARWGAAQEETPEGLVARRGIDAAHCLHAARLLRKHLSENEANAVEVTPIAMLVEGCATRLGLEPLLSKVSKFSRRQKPAEFTKQWFSSLLYLVVRQACMDGALDHTAVLKEYEKAAAEGGDSEVYKPRSKHAFRQQLSKWRGLCQWPLHNRPVVATSKPATLKVDWS